MYKRQSYIIVFAMLLIAFSCKSETKATSKITEAVNAKIESNKEEVSNIPTDQRKVEEIPIKEETKTAKINGEIKEDVSKKNEESKTGPTPKNTTSTHKAVNEEVKDGKQEEVKPAVEEKESDAVSNENNTPQDEEGTKSDVKPEKPKEPKMDVLTFEGAPSHKKFDVLLKSFVSASGSVNYTGLKKSEADLNSYLTLLESVTVGDSWSRNDKLAFWINAYNAYTLKLILNNYPVKSITDLHGGKPWDQKWIKLNGQTLSLNNIENDIIRPTFNEPRIHFAVNCAAKSCPPLMNGAFTSAGLNGELERQTKKFINNSKYNTLGTNEITVSKIFDWYGVDFGNIAKYFNKYAPAVSVNTKVLFNEYDWSLNGN